MNNPPPRNYKTDDRPQKGSWAPGKYIHACRLCGCGFIGDKLAAHCADCEYGTKYASTIPRRNDRRRWTPQEFAIFDARQMVENYGGHPTLTHCLNLLNEAQEVFADHIEGLGLNTDGVIRRVSLGCNYLSKKAKALNCKTRWTLAELMLSLLKQYQTEDQLRPVIFQPAGIASTNPPSGSDGKNQLSPAAFTDQCTKDAAISPRFKTLGQAIKGMRRERRMSMGQLADKSKVSKSTISRIERDLIDVSVSSVAKLASAMEVTAASILESVI